MNFRTLDLNLLRVFDALMAEGSLSRAALVHADAIARVSLIKTMSDEEGLRKRLAGP